MSSLNHPHLSDLAGHVEEIRGAAASFGDRFSAAQRRWKPGDDEWSISECLDHLISTGYLYYPRLEDAIAAAPDDNTAAPYEPSVLAKLFIWTVSPDAGIKVRAFEPFEPKHTDQDVDILQMFDGQQEELLDIIHRADRVNINGGKFITPGLVRLTVGEGLTMVVQHQRRHMLQIDRLLKHPGFPA